MKLLGNGIFKITLLHKSFKFKKLTINKISSTNIKKNCEEIIKTQDRKKTIIPLEFLSPKPNNIKTKKEAQ